MNRRGLIPILIALFVGWGVICTQVAWVYHQDKQQFRRVSANNQ
jgi:hypothetical protein